MWCCQADKFTGHDDLRILPEDPKVLTIAGDQKVGAGCVGALDKMLSAGSLVTSIWR